MSASSAVKSPVNLSATDENATNLERFNERQTSYKKLPQLPTCCGANDEGCTSAAVTRPRLDPSVTPTCGVYPNYTHCWTCAGLLPYQFLRRNCENNDGEETWRLNVALCRKCELEKPCQKKDCEGTIWGLGRALCAGCERKKLCKNEECEETVWRAGAGCVSYVRGRRSVGMVVVANLEKGICVV